MSKKSKVVYPKLDAYPETHKRLKSYCVTETGETLRNFSDAILIDGIERIEKGRFNVAKKIKQIKEKREAQA